jgi:hypothetical protein
MIDTRAVLSVMDALTVPALTIPSLFTGTYVTFTPCSSSHLQVAVTEGCSTALVTIWSFAPFDGRITS